REHAFVGIIVADEHRPPAGEWRKLHQPSHRFSFVEALMFDLDHGLPRQRLESRYFRADCIDRALDRSLELWRLAIVQRQRIALVLDDDAGAERGDAREPLPERGAEWRCPAAEGSLAL